MAGKGKGFEKGVVRERGVRKRGLLRSPVEEAEGKRWVAKKVGVDDMGNQRWCEGLTTTQLVEGLLKGTTP